MKTIQITFIITILFCFVFKTRAQCVIDAGPDRNICQEEFYTGAILQGQIISGNIQQISWESSFYSEPINKYYYASDMLSDTNIINPVIQQIFDRTVKYYVTGITTEGEECKDSVILNFSQWTFLTIDKATIKAPNDTVELWIAASSNWPHIQYEWSPNHMISDTTVERPLVWNDTKTSYNLKITDSLGCQANDDIFEVYVHTTSAEEIDNNSTIIYPNPTNDIVFIKSKNSIKTIKIYDLNGQFITETTASYVSLQDQKPGEYLLIADHSNGQKIYFKLIKGKRP